MKNEDDRVRLSCSIMGRFLRECFDIVAKVEITFSSVYFLFFFFLFPRGERLVHSHWVSTMPLNRKIFPRKQGISHESHDRGGKSRKTFPSDNTFYVILGQRSFLDLTQIHLNFVFYENLQIICTFLSFAIEIECINQISLLPFIYYSNVSNKLKCK